MTRSGPWQPILKLSATVLAAVICIAASGRLTGASILDSIARNDPSPQRSLRWSTLAISWSPAEPISGREIWETVLEAGGGSAGCVLLAGKAEEQRLQPLAGLLLALDAVARGMPELARAEEKAAVDSFRVQSVERQSVEQGSATRGQPSPSDIIGNYSDWKIWARTPRAWPKLIQERARTIEPTLDRLIRAQFRTQ